MKRKIFYCSVFLIVIGATWLIIDVFFHNSVCNAGMQFKGDLSDFIVKEINQDGGKLANSKSNKEPILCTWYSRSDTEGCQVFTDLQNFAKVKVLLAAIIGSPDLESGHEPNEFFIGYKVIDIGVSVTCFSDKSICKNLSKPMLHITIGKEQH